MGCRRGVTRPDGMRILYVECNSADIDLTSTHLAEAAPHFSLKVVRASADALALLQTDHCDLLLADLRMPDMNALDLNTSNVTTEDTEEASYSGLNPRVLRVLRGSRRC